MKKFMGLSVLATMVLVSCKQDKSVQSQEKMPENVKEVTTTGDSSEDSSQKPMQHLKLSDLKSQEEALRVFNETSAQIKSKIKLDAQELQEIHIITYSLEKAIAYFAENLSEDQKKIAEKLAVIVEDIHLASENNKKEDCEKHLTSYFSLAEKFVKDLK